MGAAKYLFTIEQGTTWNPTLTVIDTDLTGYTARMQVRATPDAADVLLELTTENGRITINGPAGRLNLLVTDEDTSALGWAEGEYDLELVTPSGDVIRLLKGRITVDAEVTR